MLWIQNVVQAQPTVVYIREAAGGVSEFTKILISGTVGALVGIGSNIAMEYIKPWISRNNLRKVVTDQLVSELIVNYFKVTSGVRVLEKSKDQGANKENYAMAFAESILSDIDADRFEYNFANNKTLVYDIDPQKRMTTFYKALKQAKVGAEKLNNNVMVTSFKMASLQARLFLTEHNISTDVQKTVYDELDAQNEVDAAAKT